MAIQDLEIKVVASGPDGSAAGAEVSTASITGTVLGVHLSYGGSQAEAVDVAVNGEGPPDVPVLTVINKNQDGWYHPRAETHTTEGARMTYDGTYPIAADVALKDNALKVTVNDAHNGDEITVTVRCES
jgi:hypothetical protein